MKKRIKIKDKNTISDLITFALFAYNQEHYIEEAIEGAFSQIYSPMEIILSDDNSNDQTFHIMEKMAKEYTGPHKIILNRNNENMGLIRHINKIALEISTGDIIVVASGDDISLKNRVNQSYRIFKDDPRIMSVSMNLERIDEIGRLIKQKYINSQLTTLNDFINNPHLLLLGASRAYRKKIFNFFGELNPNIFAEDSGLVFRSILLGKNYHSDSIGIQYRISETSMSKRLKFEDFEAILKHRLIDSKKALDDNQISLIEYNKIIEICNIQLKKHMLKDKFLDSKVFILSYFYYVLIRFEFSFYEKRTILKEYLYRINFLRRVKKMTFFS